MVEEIIGNILGWAIFIGMLVAVLYVCNWAFSPEPRTCSDSGVCFEPYDSPDFHHPIEYDTEGNPIR